MSRRKKRRGEPATGPGAAPQPAVSTTLRTGTASSGWLLWILAAGAGLLAVMAVPILRGHVYIKDDLGTFHLPIRAFFAGCLNRGEPFDWMPQLFCGFFLTGEGQLGSYHPLTHLLYGALPFAIAFDLNVLLSYPLLFAGMYLALRCVLDRRDAAAMGALLFTFSSFTMLHFCHMNAIAILAHAPWLCWAYVRLRSASSRGRVMQWSALIALLTASQLLLGYPQYVWFSLLAEAAVVGLIVARGMAGTGRCLPAETGTLGAAGADVEGDSAGDRWSLVVFLVAVLLAKVLALFISAVQILPTLDLTRFALRSYLGTEFTNQGSLNPANFLQFVAPYLLPDRVLDRNPHEYGVYPGAVTLALACALLVFRPERDHQRRLVWFLGGVALTGMVLAIGSYGLVYRLQRFIPVIGQFRMPTRYILFTQLALAMLAAAGFVNLARQSQRRETVRLARFWPLAIPAALSALAAAIGFLVLPDLTTPRAAAILAGPLLIALACALVILAARGRNWAMPLLIVLAVVDLGAYGVSYSIWHVTAPVEMLMQSVPLPPGEPATRVYFDAHNEESGSMMGNEIILFNWRRADGYVAMVPLRSLDYNRVAALALAGVEWVFRSEGALRVEGLIEENPTDPYLRVPDPLPPQWLVTRSQVSASPNDELDSIDPLDIALVDRELELEGGEPGRILDSARRPGAIAVAVTGEARQLLVVTESHHDGWYALVDGRPVPLIRTFGDYMGCVVEPGRHRVLLQFRPASLVFGRFVSLVSLVFTLLLAVVPAVIRAVRGQMGADSRIAPT